MLTMTNYHSSVKDRLIGDYDVSAMATPDVPTLYLARMDGSVMTSMDPAWLKAELERKGRSQSALARFMGVLPETVNRICAGKRQIKATEADTIRAYLAATSNGEPATLPHSDRGLTPASNLIVRGSVEAGSWREVAYAELMEPEVLPAPRQVVESGAYALRVSGPSMDQKFADGSYVVVMPWHGGPLPIGRYVVVERARPDGLVETTLKQLVQAPNGDIELWPRSHHPAHQQPVPYKEIDGVVVRIMGTVTMKIEPV